MKKCKNCGALQSDKYFYCIDCNKKLDAPLSEEDEAKEQDKIKNNIQNLSNKSDYFYVSKSDRTIALLLGILSALHVILMIIRMDFYMEYYLHWFVLIIVIFSICISIDMCFPKISWGLYKLKFYFSINNIDDLEPSIFMLWYRRFLPKVILFLVIIAFIIMLIASFTYKPGANISNDSRQIIFYIESETIQY